MNVTVLQDTCQVPVVPLLCRLWGIYYLWEDSYFGVPATDCGNKPGPKTYLLVCRCIFSVFTGYIENQVPQVTLGRDC
jgi:hypothetical protein